MAINENIIGYNEYIATKYEYEILSDISKELQKVGILSIDELVLRLSRFYNKRDLREDEKKEYILKEIHIILNKVSGTYREMLLNQKYRGALIFVEEYIEKVLEYYKGINEYRREDFDTQTRIIREEIDLSNAYLKENRDLILTPEDINKTLSILNEAVRRYYEIYNNKKMITTFSDGEVISFMIEEARLAHLLGIKIKNIVSNKKYVDLYGITSDEVNDILNRQETIEGYKKSDKAVISVLHKIVDMQDDTVNFEMDRFEKLFKHQYRQDERYSELVNVLRKYSKINVKSKTFINFKPLEKVSMILNMPEGYSKIDGVKDPIHSLLISRNFLSGEYKWSNLVANRSNNRVYFMSSLLSNKEDLYRDMLNQKSFAVTSKVSLINDDDSGGGGGGVSVEFSEEEQRKFLKEVVKDLKEVNLDRQEEKENTK